MWLSFGVTEGQMFYVPSGYVYRIAEIELKHPTMNLSVDCLMHYHG